MKIYLAHSREFDYEKELYLPVRSDEALPQAEIILPHESGHDHAHGREFYAQLSLMIAEVSYPSTGLGIELGWAFDSEVPIVCIYRKGSHVSGSLRAVTDQFYEYASKTGLTQIIQNIIHQHVHA